MNMQTKPFHRAVLALAGGVSVLVLAGFVQAQNAALSADELQKLVEEQKAALEEVIANRSETQTMADNLREELAKSEDRKGSVEKELQALCAQQEELKSDSYKDCMNQSDS